MAGKGTRHRFELSRLEIAGVVVSAVAGLFVVFMLGIYAGRGMTDRRLDGGEQIVRLPVAPAAEQTPAAEEGLTFYDTLGRDERAVERRGERPGTEIAKAEPPAAKSAPEPPSSATKTDSASPEKPSRAEPAVPAENVAATEKTEKAEKPEKPGTAVAKAPAEDVRRAAAPTPSPAALAKNERSPAPPSTARVAVALAPVTAPTPRSQAKGEWSVQVSASRDPRTADAVLRRLRAKGYDAFVLRVRRRGETFYRVRVGHYASIEDAQQVVSRLRREPGVPEAFVASD
jgi:cell division septation protein DedD